MGTDMSDLEKDSLKAEIQYLKRLYDLTSKELTKYQKRFKILEDSAYISPIYYHAHYAGAEVYARFPEYPEGSVFDLGKVLDKAAEMDEFEGGIDDVHDVAQYY